MIDKRSRIPYHLQLKEVLKKGIENGDFKAICFLRNGHNEEYKVSRNTVRTAVLELVNEGMVKRFPGKGTYINPISNQRFVVVGDSGIMFSKSDNAS